MSATISRRALSFVPVIASVVFFAGCSPSSLDLGEVTPPDLQADPAVTTVFRFEADEMPAVVNGSFTIGNDPLTATFTGGSVVEPTDSGLARSQTQSWLIPEGESGTITLNTPAIGMALYFRNEFNPPEEVRAVPTRGGVECPAPVDFGNNAGEAFGDVLYARGSFNDWAGASSDPATDFVNLGGGIYQARFPMEAGSYNFKLANEGWTLEYADDANGPTVGTTWQVAPDTGSGDTAINIPATGCYTWTITIVDGSATPAPLIDVLIEEYVPVVAGPVVCEVPDFGNNPGEAFGAALFARGAFNDWAGASSDPPTGFINLGGGVYRAAFEMVAGSYDFKIASEDWNIEYSDSTQGPMVGTVWEVALSGGGSDNSAILIPADGCYSWTITVPPGSAVPPDLLEVLIEEFTGSGGGTGSKLTVYDVLDNEIESFDGLGAFREVLVRREEGETKISRIQIDGEVDSGTGFIAVDDFAFRAAPPTERTVTLFYSRPDGDYSGTEFVITGDIEGGDQTLACVPADDGFGCTVTIVVLPDGTFSYTVTNNGVPDEGGEIEIEYNSIIGDSIYTFEGSGVPLVTGLPVTPQENEIILFYKRPNDDYEGWGLHLFPIDTPDWTEFPTPGEYPFEGIDPVLGAYFIIALPGSNRLTEDYSRCTSTSVDGCNLSEFPESLGFLVHKGDTKDPDQDLFLRIANGNLVFVRAGVNSVSSTPPVDGGIALAGASAHWVSQDTLLWDTDASVESVQLLYSAEGTIREAGGRLVGADMESALSDGTSPVLPNSTHLEDLAPWAVPAGALDMVEVLITGQLLALGFDADGNQVEATAVQIPLLLDDLYAEAARDASLGVDYSGGAPALAVWAPTSTMVSVNIYDTADAEAPSDTLPMSFEPDSGIWTITGTAEWDRKYYTYTVTNYVPIQSTIREQETTDPYSVNIAWGGTSMARSQIINLDDTDLKPADWDTFVKPPLDAPEDIVLYELHMRDFSALDPSVMPDDQGKYTAFADGGDGSMHLADLAAAGLTHVHLLPPFDIATVNEDREQRVDLNDPIADLCALNSAAQPFCDIHSGTILEALQSYGPTDSDQAALVEVLRGVDSFNWGYDPVHFNAPEGSYASDANNASRVLEFRQMVKGLSDNGLRTVIDQVYNHTIASGTSTNAVFDKVVPGYYHRYDAVSGQILRQSCCDDTAAEHAMMEKFLVDSMEFWATEYKVDGFRLDLMSFHPLSTMELARDRLQALTINDDGVDGSKIYIYGEAWHTGIAQSDSRFTSSTQGNLGGSGIGSFNDRIRDAVRGGGPSDSGSTHISAQGFISGQYYDPNLSNMGSADELNDLLFATDWIRVAMAGGLSGFPITDHNDNVTTGSGIGAGYTDDPQEIINYIASHDGETLWDISQFKHPVGTTTADRVRAHNVGNSIILLGQGVPFLQAGQDLLRSKSMDRNTFDSGDWYNRIFWDKSDNNFAVGTPLESENSGSLTEIDPVLANAAADPGSADIMYASDVTQEFLRIRKSSQLFRLRTSGDIVNRVMFHNTGSTQVPGLIVMSIDGCVAPDEDAPEYGAIVTVFNASTDAQVFDLFGERSFDLHPLQVSSVDTTVTGAFHDADGFHVPARTTAVFIEEQSGKRVCGFGADFAGSTAFVSGDFNGNLFVNAMVGVGNTPWIETTVPIDIGAGQLYRILSSDTASINCGGPAGEGPLFTEITTGDTPLFSTLSCGSAPDELSLDSAMDARYKFALDTTNVLSPSLIIREQAGTGFPIAGGGCGVADMGNNNAEFFGEDVFVRGGFNDWLDPPPPEFQLINTGDREFQVEAEIVAGNWEFKVASADWGPEYTAVTSIALGITQTVPLGEPGAPNIPISLAEDGCYNFTVVPSVDVDMSDPPLPVSIDMTVTQIPQDTGDPTDIPLVRGGFNDWGEGDPMTMIGTATFEAVVTVAGPGDYLFKIGSADWMIVNCGGPQDLGADMDVNVGDATTISCGANPSNLTANFAVAGDYAFRIDATNRNNPTLTISTFQGAGFNTEGFGMPTVYLKGDFNAFGLDIPLDSNFLGTLYFTPIASPVTLTAGTYEFRFDSEDGTTIRCGTPSGGTSNVTVDATKTIGCGSAQANLEVTIPADGDYSFSLDAGLVGTALNPLLTINSPD